MKINWRESVDNSLSIAKVAAFGVYYDFLRFVDKYWRTGNTELLSIRFTVYTLL